MQTFFKCISQILLTDSSKFLGRPLFVIPSIMSQCNVDMHQVYPLHYVWIEAQGIHTRNHDPTLSLNHL